jgi:hypothetical protein
MAPWTQTAALLGLIAFLTACSRDSREADIKQCIATAEHQVSHGLLPYKLPPADSAEERRDQIGGVVVDCMWKAGYRHDAAASANSRCVDDLDFNPYCYRRGDE